MIVPSPNAEHVLTFCKGISKRSPFSVPIEPVVGEPMNECFHIVKEQVITHGGKGIIGWAIWEWPGVLIEAEFHMIWQAPDDSLIDITPKPHTFETITFLPDPKSEYRGRQVDNIRKPLVKSLLVRKYIAAVQALIVEMNKGDLADYHGPVELTPKLEKLRNKMLHLEKRVVDKYGRG